MERTGMRAATRWGTALLACGALLTCVPGAQAAAHLLHWPATAARQLEAAIDAHAHRGAYAVFDADNTSYRHDLEEALLPFLEMQGLLTRDTMDPALKLVPFKDGKESLYSYYLRLCAIDEQVCYPWIAQIFSGFTLRQLKGQVDALMAYGQPIPVRSETGTATNTGESAAADKPVGVVVQPPRPNVGMQELFKVLMAHGIEVYIVSAASEELVRMVMSDPRYGYNVKPQNVIGVSLLLRNRQSGELTTARKLIREGRYDTKTQAALLDYEYSSVLWAPLTWYAGKPAAIASYISEWKKPFLAAGDTPASDGPMLFHAVDVANGGLRLWINRKDEYLRQLHDMQKDGVARQKALGLPPTADRNWIVVTPEQLPES